MGLSGTSGLTAQIGASGTSATYPLTPSQQASFDNGGALLLPKLSAALGGVKSGNNGGSPSANTRILFAGDSTMLGYSAQNITYPTVQMVKHANITGQISAMFNGDGLDAHINSLMSAGATQISQDHHYFDTRIVIGSGWGGAGNTTTTVGGVLWQATGATGNLAFTPDAPIDTFNIYYATNSGLGTFSANIDGGTNTNQSQVGASGVGVLTLTTTLGIHTCNLNRVSGSVYPIGWEAYDSSRKWVSVINAGWNGSTSTNWNDNTTGFAPIAGIVALAPSCTVLMLGINDWDNAVSLSTYQTNLQTVITSILTVGDCVLVSPFPSHAGGTFSSPTTAVQQTYVNVLKTLATTNNIPFVDLFALFVDWPTSNTNGLYFDDVHLNGKGYAKAAQAIFNAIGNV